MKLSGALTATTLLALPAVAFGASEQAAQAAPTTAAAEVTQCAQAQMVVDQLLGAANARTEAARQMNSAAAMRAAVDALLATVRDVRAQLAPCALLQPADPHAGHVIPSRASPRPDSPSTSAMKPSSAITAPGDIEEWLKAYDAAFVAKDLDKLATFYHPDVTIYEGAGVNNGWIDYRDRHLGPELKAFENLEYGHQNRQVHMIGDRAAYVISEYFIKATMKERTLDNIGRETLVVEKQTDGTWRIRHSHTSGRARPQK